MMHRYVDNTDYVSSCRYVLDTQNIYAGYCGRVGLHTCFVYTTYDIDMMGIHIGGSVYMHAFHSNIDQNYHHPNPTTKRANKQGNKRAATARRQRRQRNKHSSLRSRGRARQQPPQHQGRGREFVQLLGEFPPRTNVQRHFSLFFSCTDKVDPRERTPDPPPSHP